MDDGEYRASSNKLISVAQGMQQGATTSIDPFLKWVDETVTAIGNVVNETKHQHIVATLQNLKQNVENLVSATVMQTQADIEQAATLATGGSG